MRRCALDKPPDCPSSWGAVPSGPYTQAPVPLRLAPHPTSALPPLFPAMTSPLRILIAEDEPLILRLTQTLLQSEGHTVTGVTDGQSAWEHLQDQHFDLVLSDIQMPRKTGSELLHTLLQHSRTLPFILMTGDSPSYLELPRGYKPLVLLAKPFGVDALLQAVAEARRFLPPPDKAPPNPPSTDAALPFVIVK